MIHFISDTHFGHENILKYDERPFASIEEHDETLLANINDTLKPGDTLYHLGDVAWNQEAFEKFIMGLHPKVSIKLVRGNHDNRWSLPDFVPTDVAYRNDMRRGAPPLFLSHYPHLSWPNSFHGSIHLFGHVHGNIEGVGRSMDVSANVIGYRPISLDEVLEKMKDIPYGKV